MNRKQIIHLSLTNTRFCILHIGMNHFEEYLMITSRVIRFQRTQDGNLSAIFFF